MIEVVGWVLAFLALCGWSAVNVLISRSTIQVANAFSVLEKMDARSDERIRVVLQRIADRRQQPPPAEATSRRADEAEERGPLDEYLRDRGTGFVLDQPDPNEEGLEIVEHA